MKFLEIDLLAYGHFSQRRLSFPGDGPNLHIIHGPNEAGKSTTLRAISGFLYGIDRRTTDAYRFAGSELRIGARLRHSSGLERYFERRKSSAGSLRSAEGAPLDETELSDWLSVKDRKQFESMFGLSHEQLRRAGESLATSKHAAAEALFGAVLDGASLRATLTQIQRDSDQILKGTGRSGELAKVMKAYRELRKEAKRRSASSRQWKLQRDALREAEARVEELERRLRDRRIELRRAERLHKVLPWLRQRREAVAALEDLGPVRRLAEDTGERRRALLREIGDARGSVGELREQLAGLRTEREGLSISEALLAFSPRVRIISEELGTYKKARKDRPGLVNRLLPYRKRAEELLGELGRPDLPLEEVESLRIPAAEQRTIRRLQQVARDLDTEERQLRGQLAEAEAALEVQQGELKELATPADVAALSATWERVQSSCGVARELAALDRELTELGDGLAASALELGLDSVERADIERLRIPSMAEIERAEEAARRGEERRRLLAEQRREVADDLDLARASLRASSRRGPVPSPEALRDARALRDRLWAALRGAYLAGDLGEVRLRIERAAELDAATREADALADAICSASERVAEHTRGQVAVEEAAQKLEELGARLAALDEDAERRRAAWRQLWEGAGVEPGTPGEMRAWRRTWERLLEQMERWDVASAEVERLEKRREALRRELLSGLELVGQPRPEDADLAALCAEVRRVIRQSERDAQRRRALETALQTARVRLQKLQNERGNLAARRARWDRDWAAATAGLSPGGPIGVDAASEVLDRLPKLFEAVKEWTALEKRIAAVSKDIRRFEEALDDRIRQAGLALEGNPAERASALLEKVGEATQAARRREALDGQLRQVQDKLGAAERRLRRGEAALQELCAAAGCADAEALERAERRSERARQLDGECARAEEHISELGDEWSLRDLERAAEGLDGDEVLAEKEALADQIRELEEKLGEARSALGECRERLRQYTAGDEAAAQLQEAASEAGRARVLAARSARLRVATLVLERAMARYQEENQGAILRRAGALFTGLTGGRYEGLRVEYGRSGATIQCRRGDRAVQVKEGVMSDGTLDQLYLALRLASIERHLELQEPMPLVLDDIFIHFDDERTRAGIEVLAEFAQKTQVLLLTHHRRNLEIAERALPPEAWRALHL